MGKVSDDRDLTYQSLWLDARTMDARVIVCSAIKKPPIMSRDKTAATKMSSDVNH
jgi:hypothetical protein